MVVDNLLGAVWMIRAFGTAAIASGMMLLYLGTASRSAESGPLPPPFPHLELPPPVDSLIGLTPMHTRGRAVHLSLIRREAERQGIPADVADAVAHIESSYDPNAVGGVGEVGLMQIRPQTAFMLGHKGTVAELFVPETNVRYSVSYLAGAWRLAHGDLCRALMKYRAGHGEERMTPLSVEYCRRARGYLAAIGSPLGQGALIAVGRPAGPVGATTRTALTGSGTSATSVRLAGAQLTETGPHTPRRTRRLKGTEFWAAHEARIKVLTAKLKRSQVRMAAASKVVPQN